MTMRLVPVIIVLLHTCQGFRFISLPGLGEYHEECVKESGINLTEHMSRGQHHSPQNFKPTHDMKCFKKCLLEKSGYLNESHVISIPDDKLAKHVNVTVCKRKEINDTCELAYQIEKCLMKQIHTKHRPKMARGGPFQQIYQYRNTCIAELNLNESSAQRLPMYMEISNETKCLQKCMLEKAEFVDKDGKIQEELWPHHARSNWSECQSIKENDKCQEVYLKNLCMMDMNGPPGFTGSVKSYEVAQYKNKCMSELKINITNYPLFRPPAPRGRGVSEQSKDLKCLERCIMIKAGYLTENNKLLTKKWNLDDGIDVERCISIDDEDACEQSYSMHHCLQEEKMLYWREYHRQRNMGFYN